MGSTSQGWLDLTGLYALFATAHKSYVSRRPETTCAVLGATSAATRPCFASTTQGTAACPPEAKQAALGPDLRERRPVVEQSSEMFGSELIANYE